MLYVLSVYIQQYGNLLFLILNVFLCVINRLTID